LRNPAKGTFAGLIDGTFGLLRPTWRTALLCGGSVSLPAAALYGWAYDRVFAAYARLAATADGVPGTTLAGLGSVFLWILAAALAQGLAALLVRACVTARAAEAVRGGRVAAPATAAKVLQRDAVRLVGQRTVQLLAYAGVLVGVYLVALIAAAFVGALGRAAASPWRLLGIIALACAAAMVAWAWLWVRFSFTLESMVIDGARERQSYGLSASLVRGNRWRVLGYRLLFAVMLGFVASLVATPIVFFATIRAYAQYLSEMVQGTARAGSLLDMIRAMGAGLPVRLAVFQYLHSVLTAFFAPAFMTLLYFEMKRRSSEGT
jgi:hypothetical protein